MNLTEFILKAMFLIHAAFDLDCACINTFLITKIKEREHEKNGRVLVTAPQLIHTLRKMVV